MKCILNNIIFSVSTLLLMNHALASEQNFNQASTNINSASSAVTSAPKYFYLASMPGMRFILQTCPTADQLVKNTNLVWSAPDGWKSYGQSYVQSIDHFASAQWQGTDIGKVVCVYVPKGRANFPIILEKQSIAPTPHGGMWIPPHNGISNCLSNSVYDCPFLLEASPPPVDPLQQIDFFKNKPDTEDN